MRPVHEIIRSAPVTPETARGGWTGETARARFEGARESDKQRAKRRTFGKR